ncbi:MULTISPECIES: hypothetical protein [unclassified Microcoleus]|uniref:hypothetical protein n=1 Tax=unclassified Microcoleus TaxID=2642155 RepID=UPI002FD6B603
MVITIGKHKDKYFGKDDEGRVALLRIPGLNGEAEDVGSFKRLNESYCTWLPLCADTFPAGSYTPETLFTNWADFPELHQVQIMAWDEAVVASTQSASQYVQTLIDDYKKTLE